MWVRGEKERRWQQTSSMWHGRPVPLCLSSHICKTESHPNPDLGLGTHRTYSVNPPQPSGLSLPALAPPSSGPAFPLFVVARLVLPASSTCPRSAHLVPSLLSKVPQGLQHAVGIFGWVGQTAQHVCARRDPGRARFYQPQGPRVRATTYIVPLNLICSQTWTPPEVAGKSCPWPGEPLAGPGC